MSEWMSGKMKETMLASETLNLGRVFAKSFTIQILNEIPGSEKKKEMKNKNKYSF